MRKIMAYSSLMTFTIHSNLIFFIWTCHIELNWCIYLFSYLLPRPTCWIGWSVALCVFKFLSILDSKICLYIVMLILHCESCPQLYWNSILHFLITHCVHKALLNLKKANQFMGSSRPSFKSLTWVVWSIFPAHCFSSFRVSS